MQIQAQFSVVNHLVIYAIHTSTHTCIDASRTKKFRTLSRQLHRCGRNGRSSSNWMTLRAFSRCIKLRLRGCWCNGRKARSRLVSRLFITFCWTAVWWFAKRYAGASLHGGCLRSDWLAYPLHGVLRLLVAYVRAL